MSLPGCTLPRLPLTERGLSQGSLCGAALSAGPRSSHAEAFPSGGGEAPSGAQAGVTPMERGSLCLALWFPVRLLLGGLESSFSPGGAVRATRRGPGVAGRDLQGCRHCGCEYPSGSGSSLSWSTGHTLTHREGGLPSRKPLLRGPNKGTAMSPWAFRNGENIWTPCRESPGWTGQPAPAVAEKSQTVSLCG